MINIFRSTSEISTRMYTPSTFPNTVESTCRCCYRKAEEKKYQRCGKCRKTYYCSSECQKEDWKVHKERCFSVDAVEKAVGRHMIFTVKCLPCSRGEWEEIVKYSMEKSLNPKKPEDLILPTNIKINTRVAVKLSSSPKDCNANLLNVSLMMAPSLVEHLLDIEPESQSIAEGTKVWFSTLLYTIDQMKVWAPYETEECARIINMMIKRGLGFSMPTDVSPSMSLTRGLLECGFDSKEFLEEDWGYDIISREDQETMKEAFRCGYSLEGENLEYIQLQKKSLSKAYDRITSKKPETRQLFLEKTNLLECLIGMILNYLCNEL